MPTGYTADVQDGKITELRAFILVCARAFGACIEQRDDPLSDKPKIPKFDGIHHADRILHVLGQLKETPKKADPVHDRAARDDDYGMAIVRWNERYIRREQTKARYTVMLDKVRAWAPPTSEHENLKSFMIEQLESSLKFDCDGGKYDKKPKKPSVQEWLDTKRTELARDRDYHAETLAKEVKRYKERTDWLENLFKALPPAQQPEQTVSDGYGTIHDTPSADGKASRPFGKVREPKVLPDKETRARIKKAVKGFYTAEKIEGLRKIMENPQPHSAMKVMPQRPSKKRPSKKRV